MHLNLIISELKLNAVTRLIILFVLIILTSLLFLLVGIPGGTGTERSLEDSMKDLFEELAHREMQGLSIHRPHGHVAVYDGSSLSYKPLRTVVKNGIEKYHVNINGAVCVLFERSTNPVDISLPMENQPLNLTEKASLNVQNLITDISRKNIINLFNLPQLIQEGLDRSEETKHLRVLTVSETGQVVVGLKNGYQSKGPQPVKAFKIPGRGFISPSDPMEMHRNSVLFFPSNNDCRFSVLHMPTLIASLRIAKFELKNKLGSSAEATRNDLAELASQALSAYLKLQQPNDPDSQKLLEFSNYPNEGYNYIRVDEASNDQNVDEQVDEPKTHMRSSGDFNDFVVYKLTPPFNNSAIKLLGHEYNEESLNTPPEDYYFSLTSVFKKALMTVQTIDWRRPLSSPYFLAQQSFTDDQFLDETEPIAEAIKKIKSASVLILVAHGGVHNLADSNSQPFINLAAIEIPATFRDRPGEFICRLFYYFYRHIHGQNYISPNGGRARDANEVIQLCRLSGSLFNDGIVSQDERIRAVIYGTNQNMVLISTSVDLLIGPRKSFVKGHSCGARVSEEFIRDGLFNRAVVPFGSFYNPNRVVDLIYSTCFLISPTHYGPGLCTHEPAVQLAYDLFGVTRIRAKTPGNPSGFIWALDMNSILSENIPYTTCRNANIRNFIHSFAPLTINSKATLQMYGIHARDFSRDNCPSDSTFYQVYAIAGQTHQDFSRGFTHPSLPSFPRDAAYNYTLRTAQHSIDNRGSYYYGILQENIVVRLDGQPAAAVLPAGGPDATGPSLSLLRRPGNGLFRHRQLIDRSGNPNAFGIAPTVREIEFNENQNLLKLYFDGDISSFGYKILLSERLTRFPEGQGRRQRFDFSGIVLNRSPRYDRTDLSLTFEFKTDRIKFLPRGIWSLPIPTLQRMYPGIFDQNSTQFNWPFYLEVHLEPRGAFNGLFAGNATREMARNSFSHRTRFWIWPLNDPLNIRREFRTQNYLSHAALRSPPYLLGHGALYNLDGYLMDSTEIYAYDVNFMALHRDEMQTHFVLRLPVVPLMAFCFSSREYECRQIALRQQSRGGASPHGECPPDTCQCYAEICGENTDKTFCVNFGEGEFNENEPTNMEYCESYGGQCCPPIRGECGETVQCQLYQFRNPQDLEAEKQNCLENNGVWTDLCTFYGYEQRCSSDNRQVCSQQNQCSRCVLRSTRENGSGSNGHGGEGFNGGNSGNEGSTGNESETNRNGGRGNNTGNSGNRGSTGIRGGTNGNGSNILGSTGDGSKGGEFGAKGHNGLDTSGRIEIDPGIFGNNIPLPPSFGNKLGNSGNNSGSNGYQGITGSKGKPSGGSGSSGCPCGDAGERGNRTGSSGSGNDRGATEGESTSLGAMCSCGSTGSSSGATGAPGTSGTENPNFFGRQS